MAATRWKGSTEQRNLRQFQTSLHNKSGIKIIFCAKQRTSETKSCGSAAAESQMPNGSAQSTTQSSTIPKPAPVRGTLNTSLTTLNTSQAHTSTTIRTAEDCIAPCPYTLKDQVEESQELRGKDTPQQKRVTTGGRRRKGSWGNTSKTTT